MNIITSMEDIKNIVQIKEMDYRELQTFLKKIDLSAKGSYDELQQRCIDAYNEYNQTQEEQNNEDEIEKDEQQNNEEEHQEDENETIDIKNQLWSKLSEVMPYVERINVNITNDATNSMKTISFIQISLNQETTIEVDEDKITLKENQYNANLKLLPLDCVFLKEHVVDMNFSSFNTWGEKTLTLTIQP